MRIRFACRFRIDKDNGHTNEESSGFQLLSGDVMSIKDSRTRARTQIPAIMSVFPPPVVDLQVFDRLTMYST